MGKLKVESNYSQRNRSDGPYRRAATTATSHSNPSKRVSKKSSIKGANLDKEKFGALLVELAGRAIEESGGTLPLSMLGTKVKDLSKKMNFGQERNVLLLSARDPDAIRKHFGGWQKFLTNFCESFEVNADLQVRLTSSTNLDISDDPIHSIPVMPEASLFPQSVLPAEDETNLVDNVNDLDLKLL